MQEKEKPSIKETLVQKLNNLRVSTYTADLLKKIPIPDDLFQLMKWGAYAASSKIAYGDSDMPMSVSIETIAACTKSCDYCPVSLPEFPESRAKRVMSDEVYETAINQLVEINEGSGFEGVVYLNGYGEPTIDRKIVERTAYAHDNLPNAQIAFFSNGDLLTNELYNELVDAGINKIIVTLHEPDNINPELWEIEKTQATPVLELRGARNTYFNRGGTVEIEEERLVGPDKRCVGPTYAINIDVEGRVLLCCNDGLSTLSMGNIVEENMFDIWKSEKYSSLRYDLRRGNWDKTPGFCNDCRVSN